MGKKVVSPAAINALKESLTSIYWFKKDLKSYLFHSLSEPEILNRLDWDDYKRNVVSNLIDYLASNQEKYKDVLLFLMSDIVKMKDFSHLARLEDGKEKVKVAIESVKALEKLYKSHDSLVIEQKRIVERRMMAQVQRKQKQAVNEKINELNNKYLKLLTSVDAHSRGYELETIVKQLFVLYDLDPKSSFRVQGEQIDGAFTFDNTDYLFEAKWRKELTGVQELDTFSSKIARKLDNTLGLFLSINGFSETAVVTHSAGRKNMILMDGSDLMAVLERRIDLVQLLSLKRRHASQTGNIYLKSHEIIL
ncbi:restriction endonuclease [Bacillus cereus]|uniref:restriction endonuclease n=1 Tax=Bacillus cereus TaxID=1396 RepID=UPI003557619D|nr:restriction endonuclease [Bacillus cereus]